MSLHRDAAAIDALGKAKIVEHFQCSEAIIRRWRHKGVSKMCRKPFALLCVMNGVEF